MRIKLYESKWLHSIEGDLANRFRTALINDDVEGAIPLSIELLNACKKFFDPEGEDDYKLEELDSLIEDFENVEHEYEPVDNLLDVLYDFCDENNIWIPLIDEEDEEKPEDEPAPADDVITEPELNGEGEPAPESEENKE